MKNIIDDPINKNIELYSAFFQFVSIITLQKISTIETRKNELKDQMKNSYQKKSLLLIKGEQVVSLSTFYLALFINFHTIF
ncbi:DNA mismatch repair protein MutT [Bacillus wiedmannii]|nr:DNA mismatch repair protein MutT [Bacillus wiedmannii]